MRLLVNCPSGESRLLQVNAEATVTELKQVLQEAEGIPVKQQVLWYAGNQLKDHLSLAEHNLEAYTLSEVVLYLNRKLSDPRRIFLTSRHKPAQPAAEVVESDMHVGAVMSLLESRGFASAFAPGAHIVGKRQDNSTLQVSISPEEPLCVLEQRIGQAEGVMPDCFTFYQAQDGHLHMSVYPSAPEVTNTFPVYQRSTRPQTKIFKKDDDSGQALPDLVKEICVLP